MFEFLKNTQKISDLTTQKALLEIKVQQLENKIEYFNSREDTSQQAFSIDFNKLDVFSVERNGDKQNPCTIIGHFLTNADGTKYTNEWYLYCSPLTHSILVEEFNEHKLKGQNGTK